MAASGARISPVTSHAPLDVANSEPERDVSRAQGRLRMLRTLARRSPSMAHIATPCAGLRGLYAFRPAVAAPMRQLVDVLLRGPGTLTLAERELIATYVSQLNDCSFCTKGHGARAAAHLGGNEELVRNVMRGYDQAEISGKLKALLAIAGTALFNASATSNSTWALVKGKF